MQLDHYTSKFTKQEFSIILVCDHITNAPNIGSLFRTADAFGVQKLMLCGNDIILGRKMMKTSRATEKSVVYELNNNCLSVVQNLKRNDYQIIALEITNTSKALHNITFKTSQPLALVIGDENFGISEAILKLSDHIIHIDMFGKNSSMNVVQATNIALYEITKQLNNVSKF